MNDLKNTKQINKSRNSHQEDNNKKILEYETLLKKNKLRLNALSIVIRKQLDSEDYFSWGCVVGIKNHKIDLIKINSEFEDEEEISKKIKPIVKIKYGSPYRGISKGAEIIKWY